MIDGLAGWLVDWYLICQIHHPDPHHKQNRNYLEAIPFDACPDFPVAYHESEDVCGYTGTSFFCIGWVGG